MMTLNNGATDGESDSHTVILGGVERFEKSVRSLRGKSNSRIFHRQTHMIVFVFFVGGPQVEADLGKVRGSKRAVQRREFDSLQTAPESLCILAMAATYAAAGAASALSTSP